jgi:hypothetical protein
MAARTRSPPMTPPAIAPLDVCFLLSGVVEPSAPGDVGAEPPAPPVLVPEEEEGLELGTEDFEEGWKSSLSPGLEKPPAGSTFVALPSGLKVL